MSLHSVPKLTKTAKFLTIQMLFLLFLAGETNSNQDNDNNSYINHNKINNNTKRKTKLSLEAIKENSFTSRRIKFQNSEIIILRKPAQSVKLKQLALICM